MHAISRLDTTIHWGEGRTSASDGQRFAMPHKVLQQTYSTRFSDFALEFYSFIADNYAPFYSLPIECTDRDSAFVLDGLCYNESDLELEEHYTDTHGYTEINFAAFAMLGGGSARAFAASRSNTSTASTPDATTGRWPAWWAVPTARSTRRPSSSSGTGWGSSMRRWSAVTRQPRLR